MTKGKEISSYVEGLSATSWLGQLSCEQEEAVDASSDDVGEGSLKPLSKEEMMEVVRNFSYHNYLLLDAMLACNVEAFQKKDRTQLLNDLIKEHTSGQHKRSGAFSRLQDFFSKKHQGVEYDAFQKSLKKWEVFCTQMADKNAWQLQMEEDNSSNKAEDPEDSLTNLKTLITSNLGEIENKISYEREAMEKLLRELRGEAK